MDGRRRAIVLDTSAFIAGYTIPEEAGMHYTTPSVLEEARVKPVARAWIEASVRSGKLIVKQPGREFVEEVSEKSRGLGEESLSDTDVDVLALALQLDRSGFEVTVVSDDYSVQNVAASLGIGFKALTTRGIEELIKWVVYCPACKKTYTKPPRGMVCPVCGTQLKRKAVEKFSLR